MNNRIKTSGAYTSWKGLTSAQRFYIAVGAAAVLILFVFLLTSYWDVPQLPSPSGEGG